MYRIYKQLLRSRNDKHLQISVQRSKSVFFFIIIRLCNIISELWTKKLYNCFAQIIQLLFQLR